MPRALVLLLVVLAAGAESVATALRPATPQSPKAGQQAANSLPPLSYICPMPGDEDVIEDKPGKCRKCGMELEPIRLDSVWTCPVHAAITREQPGKCPIDGRQLVPMTMAVSWTCPAVKGMKDSLTPGACPDGSPMVRKYTARPHGNHNPQHGGSFFMASDNWHHLEGAYFAPGTFRLYLYDDYTKPLSLEKVRAIQARLILTRDGKELPLVRNGRVLEAKIGKLPFPAVMQARVKFQSDGKENLFDFTFEQFSKDLPAAAPATTMTATAPAGSRSGAAAPTGSAAASGAPAASRAPAAAAPTTPAPAPAVETVPSAIDSALVPVPIPETVPEILAQLRTRNAQIKTLIDRGAFASVYVPAFQAKDLALALDEKKGDLPPDRQKIVGPAVNQVVRTAYLLDAFGDLGNRQQITDAYTGFAAAVRDIESAFPKQP